VIGVHSTPWKRIEGTLLGEKSVSSNYPDAYRHFDKLIWQIPAWATALFLGVLVAICRVYGVEHLPWGKTSKETICELILFSAILFHSAASYSLFRFRIHQSSVSNVVGPFAKAFLLGSQFWLQFSVLLETGVLLSLLLRVFGGPLWLSLLYTSTLSFVLTVVCEKKVKDQKKQASDDEVARCLEWICKEVNGQRKGNTYVLAKCGVWRAELARNVYSKGQVFIMLDNTSFCSFPNYLGEKCKRIPEPENLIGLIESVSKAMVEALPDCEKVYLASLNEGGNRLHFWLIPRNGTGHKEFLEQKGPSGEKNDGFALMAKLREDFLKRRESGNWEDMVPPPDCKSHPEWQESWEKYANDCFEKFRHWWKDHSETGL
jgi:hypothetical protein